MRGLWWFVDQETEKSFDEVHLRLNLGFVDSRFFGHWKGGALLEKNSFVHLFLLLSFRQISGLKMGHSTVFDQSNPRS